jgi:hypothetical protein
MPDDVATTPAPEPVAAAAGKAPYSAVVYFHGMGSQRRYEETSRLVDCLDRYVVSRQRDGKPLGVLRGVKARVEPLRSSTPSNDIVGYIRTRYLNLEAGEASTVRFYEAYWAPVMAGSQSAWGIVKWLFRQPLRPWRTLRTPWRERQRLRRASLVALFESDRTGAKRIAEADYTRLMGLYDDFEGLDAQRRYHDGTFDDFLAFIAERCAKDPGAADRCQALARKWRAAYRWSELRNAGLLALMAVTLALLVVGVLLGILFILQSVLAFAPLAELLARFGEPPKADWKAAVAVGIALATLVGVTRFLTDYLGDVEAWATYEETDVKHAARNKVLDLSMQILTHVLSDPACERVTVVAHSLGTSVAHDALLALNRRNMALRPKDPIAGPVPLHKIEHFVTMGSPIDKIEYFFESYSSASHRYKRVIEALRGDIGTSPFTRNKKPFVHWINFWDQGDPISGALQSPASAVNFRQRVDNVHIASFRFPDPAASHAGYFTHRTVVDTLFHVIYRRAWSFRTLKQPAPDQPYDYDSVYRGPGEKLGTRLLFSVVAFLTPLFVLLGLAGWLFEMPLASYAGWGASSLSAAILVIGCVASRLAGQQNRI